MKKRWFILLAVAIAVLANMKIELPSVALGEGGLFGADKKIQQHYVNATTMKSDNTYKKRETIKNGDKHFGLELGQFVISGYTRIEDDGQGNVLVIKGEDDEIHLTFDLRKDIDNLKSNEKLKIHDDGDGSDEEMGYARPKEGFGRGVLLWQFMDNTGYKSPIKSHKDYLVALTNDNSDKEIIMNEEGDWIIALDYETAYPVLAWDGCDQYTIRINVKIRNGNCMAYLREVDTGKELKDADTTNKGFFIDLANSKYLKIDVSRANIGENDIRNNSPYTDGTSFTESGNYTITIKNEYTGASTVKKITVNAD